MALKIAANPSLEVNSNWKALWKLKVPPRVKDLVWRAVIECLPTKVNLFAKHIVHDKICVRCGNQLESK